MMLGSTTTMRVRPSSTHRPHFGMPWSPRNDRPGPRESRGGGGGGGGRPSGLMATGYGSDRRNGGRSLRKQGHPRRSAAIPVRFRGLSSSRSCSQPGGTASRMEQGRGGKTGG